MELALLIAALGVVLVVALRGLARRRASDGRGDHRIDVERAVRAVTADTEAAREAAEHLSLEQRLRG